MDSHPRLENPSEAQLEELLENRGAVIRQLYLDIHRLIRETLPGVTYSVDMKDGMAGYAARQYGYDGWGMAALAAHTKWVSLMFMRGAELEDPHGLLEGGGKKMRHVKIRTSEELDEKKDALRQLIKAAAGHLSA